ncbi:MAG: flagellar biosynthesis protein FlhB [Sulfurimonadaceae bacterium]|nr:flagellar biosynthesis protein FlhB [Sulfurimonadaceae bacterium]
MADDQEKTEEPTSKKIEDARNEGNVPKSQDAVGILTLVAALLAFLMLFTFMAERVENLVRYYFTMMGTDLTREVFIELALITFKEFLIIALPLAIIIAVAGLVSNVSVIGFLFTTKPLVPDIKKLDPIKGLQNVISLKKVLEGFMMTLKSLTAMGVGFIFFGIFIQELPTVALFSFGDQLQWIGGKALIIALMMLLVLFIFALFDLIIKRKQYFDKLKMSKQEVKDEMKNMEGDPHIKAKIRQIQMQASRKRMMAEVPEADVVITNPTHYAVAIKYDEQKHNAPMVVAKGKDNIALQIKKIAREHNVHIVQNPPLARSLYKDVDVDKPIPEALFSAVAEVLAYVYKMENRTR